MHRHLYRHMDRFQRIAFCAFVAIIGSTAATMLLKALFD
jgi:hypothetical protein